MVSHSSILELMQTYLMVADVSWLGTGDQPGFGVSQWDALQQQQMCVASGDGQCPALVLSEPEDCVLWSHPLYCPDQVPFLLQPAPGRHHSQLE